MLTIKNGRTGTVWVLPTAVVVGMLMLSACGAQATPTAAVDATTAPVQSGSVTDAPPATEAPAVDATAKPISFKNDVLPILQSRCVKCHGGEKTAKGLSLIDYQHLIAGTAEDGPAIVPGNAAKSKAIQMVQAGKMPKMSAKLLPEQIQILIDWINQGALNN